MECIEERRQSLPQALLGNSQALAVSAVNAEGDISQAMVMRASLHPLLEQSRKTTRRSAASWIYGSEIAW